MFRNGSSAFGKAFIDDRWLRPKLEERRTRMYYISYRCNAETLVARPPNEEAIVLNSTCLISGSAFVREELLSNM